MEWHGTRHGGFLDHGCTLIVQASTGLDAGEVQECDDHQIKVVEALDQRFIACFSFSELCTQGARHNGRMNLYLDFCNSFWWS
jgi:hypothetical protein